VVQLTETLGFIFYQSWTSTTPRWKNQHRVWCSFPRYG